MFVATHIKPSSVGWNTILKRTWQEARADDLLGRSAQLSYYFFLALLPFLICTLTTLAIFYGRSDQVQRGLLSLISSALPGSAANLVEKALTQIDQAHASSKISVGILFWLWSASNGMSAIMDALNAEYEVKETRSFLGRTAIAIVLTAVAA